MHTGEGLQRRQGGEDLRAGPDLPGKGWLHQPGPDGEIGEAAVRALAEPLKCCSSAWSR